MSELKIEQIREFVISKKDGNLNNLFAYLEKEDELQLIIDVFNECKKQANETSTSENKALDIDLVSVSDSSDFELQRLLDWLQDTKREPAQTKFTAGMTRNVAREFESLLNHVSDPLWMVVVKMGSVYHEVDTYKDKDKAIERMQKLSKSEPSESFEITLINGL